MLYNIYNIYVIYIYNIYNICNIYIYGNQPVNQANKVLVKFSQGFTSFNAPEILGFTRRKHRKCWGIVFVGRQNGGNFGGKMVGKWWECIKIWW